MVPVSSAFVRLIVVHVQAPRGLKHVTAGNRCSQPTYGAELDCGCI